MTIHVTMNSGVEKGSVGRVLVSLPWDSEASLQCAFLAADVWLKPVVENPGRQAREKTSGPGAEPGQAAEGCQGGSSPPALISAT